MKFIATLVLIFGIGGCIVVSVIANEKRTTPKNYNKQYQDTPLYYKRYMGTSIVYKSKHGGRSLGGL